MLNGIITRGTTANLVFPLNTIDKIVSYSISYKQKKHTVITQRKTEDVFNTIKTTLTTDETLLFNPAVDVVQIQIKGLDQNGFTSVIGNYRYRLADVFDESDLEG